MEGLRQECREGHNCLPGVMFFRSPLMAPSGSWWDGRKASISVTASSLVPGIEGQFADLNCFPWCHQSIWGGKGIHGRQAKTLCLARKHECDTLLIECLEEKLSLWSTWLKFDYQYTNSSAQGYGQLTPVSPCKEAHGLNVKHCGVITCHFLPTESTGSMQSQEKLANFFES